MKPLLTRAMETTYRAPVPKVTLQRMVDLVMAEYQDPAIVELATRLAVAAPEKNTQAVAASILRWLRASVHFVPDPLMQQLLRPPLYMLAAISRDGITGGNCVDVAMLGASLAMAVGLPAQFISEGYAPVDNSPLVHVYTIVDTTAGWLALDTQRTPTEVAGPPARRVVTSIP